MEHDYDERPGWVRLPGYDDDYPRAARSRAGGVRRVRRASNWTAAALIAGVAATTGYFAHHQAPATATSSVTGVPGSQAGTAASPGKPTLNSPVATSGGSGVTIGPNGTRIVSYKDN
jgi:hypothetical protein